MEAAGQDALVGVTGDAGPDDASVRAPSTRDRSHPVSAASLHAILDASPNAILLVDAGGRITYANRQVEWTFGHRPAALVGAAVEVLVPDALRDAHAAQRDRFLAARHERGFGVHPNLSGRRRDGTTFPVDVALGPVDLDTGPGVVVNVMDAGTRHRLEEQLLQAQKMELMGRFTNMLAHDFRNYLTAIGGLADIASSRECGADGPVEELALIQSAVAAADAAVHGILGLGRPARADDRTAVGRHLAENALLLERLLLPPWSLGIAVVDPLPDAAIAPSALTQILMNLVTNARDAMPDGGRIVISARLVRGPAGIRGPGGPVTGAVCIAVTDTGIGMDELTQSRIFEPFYTTKTASDGTGSGSGLGLASVGMLVSRARGSIRVESAPSAGTTVEILLPPAGLAETPPPDPDAGA